MAIVKMKHLAVIGLSDEREGLMNALMKFGVCELSDQSHKMEDELWKNNTKTDVKAENISELSSRMDKAEESLEIVTKYGKIKSGLFSERRVVSQKELSNILDKKDETWNVILDIRNKNEKILKKIEYLSKLEQDRSFLKRWEGYSVPLDIISTQNTLLKTGFLQSDEEYKNLQEKIEGTPSILEKVFEEKDAFYIALLVYRDFEKEIDEVLKEVQFQEISFKGYIGTASDNLLRISEEEKSTNLEIESLKEEIKELSKYKNDIENYYDVTLINLEREKIKEKLLLTKDTFMMEGWVPERRMEDVRILLEKYGCYYVFENPTDSDEVPVLLDNPSFFRPCEAVTEMYSLPAYKGFDPTSIFALFYIIFFGMMFGDAGYGLVMAIGCFVILKKFKLEGTTYKMIKLFMYSGVSTFIFGMLFGSFFGNIFEAFSGTFLGKTVSLDALWFNPMDNPMLLLGISLVLGVIHLFTGMGIQAYMQIKDGRLVDAICDEGFWYLTITGLMMLLGGSILDVSWMPEVGKWLSIIGALGLLLTGGRDKKGFGKVTGGLSNIYNITSWLSDILSYARILALGLATGVIGEVVNTMGSIFGGGILGLILFILIFIVGHLINFAINALGSFIHAARLQYVEFFGKFYIDGGEPFNPYRIKTKYIKITEE